LKRQTTNLAPPPGLTVFNQPALGKGKKGRKKKFDIGEGESDPLGVLKGRVGRKRRDEKDEKKTTTVAWGQFPLNAKRKREKAKKNRGISSWTCLLLAESANNQGRCRKKK